jgi:hypothetical protein
MQYLSTQKKLFESYLFLYVLRFLNVSLHFTLNIRPITYLAYL